MSRTLSFAVAAAAVAALAACSTAPANDAAGSLGAVPYGNAAAFASVKPGTEQDLQVNVGDRVFFATDSSDPGPEGLKVLQRQAEWLRQYPNVTVTIEGHCDERGTREYNLGLGNRRAYAVKTLLVAQGVPAERIATISYGKERPAATGSDEASWAQNRRAVTVVEPPPRISRVGQ